MAVRSHLQLTSSKSKRSIDPFLIYTEEITEMVGTVKTENGSYIELKVQMQNQRDHYFTIRRNEALQTVLVGYCKLEDKEFEATRFFFDGKRVQACDTPDELGMEEEDVIDAFQEMFGGTRILISHWKPA
ncbi:PREDICTED: small ubiquitin-related modifier 2-like [Ipomoea nil]|uniref:small ubiquitin-related modifier 2-like n=1 Tax=Ipomoea nil TaxID=35883 RepID=UPI000901FD6E|nr:PREDICTED: small ubiquitin-related modifier 2-like [Ipomoea nil]